MILQKSRFQSILSRLKVLTVVSVIGLSSQQAFAEGIEWQVAPYLWTFDTSLDLTVNNDPVLGIDLPFKDVVDKIDTAFMGYVEGRGEYFGLFGDVAVVNLADTSTKTVGPGGPILGDLIIDSSLKLKLYEVGGFYRIGQDSSVAATFDFLLGARLVDIDQKFDITLPDPGAGQIQRSPSVSEVDVFIGGRLLGQLSKSWHYTARIDMAGGGTDGTLNMLASVGYTFGQSGLFSLDLGYKYMAIDLSSNDGATYVDSEIKLAGPVLGFIFNF